MSSSEPRVLLTYMTDKIVTIAVSLRPRPPCFNGRRSRCCAAKSSLWAWI